MEFKKAKKDTSLKSSAEDALKQIADKRYVAELHNRGITQVITLGIAFQGKETFIQQGFL